MHIKCPHCQNPVELVESTDDTASVTCPSCGSVFALLPETSPIPSDYGAVGQFQLLARVGRGHFGEVWKAFDETLSRVVALKMPRLSPGATTAEREYQEMFLREARSAARLRDPHIVPVHEVARTERGIIIVSDFIEGITLADVIRDKPPTPTQAAETLKTVAQAIHHAHEAGVIHRDLKPSNIIIDGAGKPYITDFGLAKRDAKEITMTIEGQILGTPAYMSPEQAAGRGHNADRRSDVYSLGVILYEMLVGERPFKSSEPHLLVHQILHDEPVPPRKHKREIPKDLETIALRAMEKDRGRRFQTAAEMAEELDRFLRGEPIVSRPISRVERGWRWAKRHQVVSALSLATAISLILFTGAAWNWYANPRRQIEKVEVEKIVPPPEIRTDVLVETIPPGAQISFIPLSDFDHTLQPQDLVAAGESPITTALKPGRYLVVAALDEQRFHEVYREVPTPGQENSTAGFRLGRFEWLENKSAKLYPIKIPEASVAAEMIPFPGSETFEMGLENETLVPRHARPVKPFLLDRTEATAADYDAAYRKDGNETTQFLVDGEPPPTPQHPVINLNWAAVVNFAEVAGKRLPEEAEYEFAATNGGTSLFPWGDAPPANRDNWWKWLPVGEFAEDALRDQPQVRGLFSNVAEWTATPGIFYPGSLGKHDSKSRYFRIVRGADGDSLFQRPPSGQEQLGARIRLILDADTQRHNVGVRFARSPKPRLRSEDFVAPPPASAE